MKNKTIINSILCSLVLLLLSAKCTNAQTTLSLNLDKPMHSVSPLLYGLMTEEINHAYDGGLYGELIKDRIFKDSTNMPADWTLIKEGAGKGSIALDFTQPINQTLNVCLKLNVETSGTPVGIANGGYWGIPVKPQTAYTCSFYAKTSSNDGSPFTVDIESNNGKITYAQAEVTGVSGEWKQYTTTLTTSKDVATTDKARFVISTKNSGTYWLTLVSLFAPTFNNRPNGNRPDIMKMMVDMKPSFLRFPGGNYLEGSKFSTRFDWKKTLGPHLPKELATWHRGIIDLPMEWGY